MKLCHMWPLIGVVAAVAAGCARRGPSSQTGSSAPSMKGSGAEPTTAERAAVVAGLPEYTVAADLSNVVNHEQFGGFAEPARKLLAQNAFVCLPTDEVQLYDIYEQNDYLQIPSFVTTDSVLQIYHIFFDYTLRTTETEKLHPVLENLTAAMLQQSVRTYGQPSHQAVKDAALRNAAYFLVAARILGLKAPPVRQEVAALAAAELKLIAAHEARMPSPIFGYDLDYTQFNPRGHYTRTERFKRFFKAMMWYGLAPFAFPRVQADGTIDWKESGRRPARQALLLVRDLFAAKHDSRPARDLWETIYEPTAFYVGAADDLYADDVAPIMGKVYGAAPTLTAFADEKKLDNFARQAAKLRAPRIQVALLGIPGGLQYRFMGQRYIPDSDMLQRLVIWPQRPWPLGLDVMAVLGSDRAAQILDEVCKEPEKWDQYVPKRKQLRAEFAALDEKKWLSNLYFGWLWSLKALLAKAPEGYPAFMRSTAWLDKSLNTCLASWAELRHDTILYAKQSGSECGDGEEPPPPPKGYVEPNPEFYGRMLTLARLSREGLTGRGLLSQKVQDKFRALEDMLSFLRRVSIKELKGEELTREEYEEIKIYGARLEGLTKSIAEGDILSETDKDMAVVADVHTSQSSALEEGVGHAAEVYVVVPIAGKLYLTRGAVFRYYEFQWPSAERLTDEKWQQMIRSRKAPNPPVWVESFFRDKRRKIPTPEKAYSSGC